MKKYLALYNMPTEGFAKFNNASDEEKQKEMEEWMRWMEAHKDSFADEGNPSGGNHRVTKDGASPMPNEVGGYSIVKAESHEAACAIFADSPHLNEPGAYVEVMEITEMG